MLFQTLPPLSAQVGPCTCSLRSVGGTHAQTRLQPITGESPPPRPYWTLPLDILRDLNSSSPN